MTTEMRTLEFKRTINAPIEQVFRAFTNAQLLREWFCDIATVYPRVNGRFYAAWNSGNALLGKYIKVSPNKRIVLALRGHDDTDRSQATIVLTAQGDTTEITLSDTSDGADWQKIIQEIEQGWNEGLDNLKSVLEDGVDLREINRPMLGIDLSEQKPNDLGVRISGVINGMDAQKAGLQKDDVIVSIGGKTTPDSPGLISVLQSFHAGDTVAVSYDRSGERQTARVKLSPRLLREIPATPAALAETVGKAYAAINTELTGLLADVDDDRARRAPAPGEWNVKQVLAHLIAGERDLHGHLTTIISGQERWQDDWEGNLPARVNAVVMVYGDVQTLLQEFICNAAETVAILAGLPDDFVTRKRSFRRIAEWLTGWTEHTGEHVEQIRTLLQAS